MDATRLRTPDLEAGREAGSALWFVDPRPICSVPRGSAPPVNLAARCLVPGPTSSAPTRAF